MKPSHTAHRQHRYSSLHVTMPCYINRMTVFTQIGISFPSIRAHLSISLCCPQLLENQSWQLLFHQTESLHQWLSCTANSYKHPLVHSNFKKQNRVRMWFWTLTPCYLLPMDSFVVILNPPVHSLIQNTLHEPLRSTAQPATVKKLDGEKESKIWDCRGELLHPRDAGVETTLQRTDKALQNR